MTSLSSYGGEGRGEEALFRPKIPPLLGRNNAVGLRANAAYTNSPNGDSRKKLAKILPLLGERAGVRARLYPQLTCSPNIRGLCFGVRNLGWISRFFSLSSSGGEGRGEEAVCSSAS